MKTTKQKHKTVIQILIVCFLMGTLAAKSQKTANSMDIDYKSIIESKGIGDNYEQKKKNFISNEPARYQEMSGEKTNVIRKLKTQKEKDDLLKIQNKTTFNSNVPEFKSQEEKTSYFQKNNLKKEIITNNNDPTFPKMIVTGDSKKDAIAFEESKNTFYKKLEEKQNRKPTKEEINAKNQSLKERGIIVVTENN